MGQAPWDLLLTVPENPSDAGFGLHSATDAAIGSGDLDSMTSHESARMKPVKRIALGLALTVASLCAHAYESDLHYGLTYWLATQAGYDALQSQEIARQNELTDTGMLDAKHAIIWDLCILQDVKASLQTRALHFRAKREPPANPAERPVNSTAAYAMGQSNSMIVEGHHEDPDLQSKFGQALHGWQDSFSHAGVSNTFFLCPDNWIWSHPVDKGSVFSHAADQTYMDVKKCTMAASSTYDLLLRFRAPMTLGTQPKDWNDLVAPVEAFCRASTKVQKADWFKAEHVPQAEAIAKNTSLDDGGHSFYKAPRIDLRRGVPSLNTVAANVPEYEQQEPGWLPAIEIDEKLKALMMNPQTRASPQAQAYARGFLKAWLTAPPDKLPEALAPFLGNRVLSQDDEFITRLRRLRLKDQGHPQAANFKSGRINPDDYVTLNGDNWTTGLIPVRGSKAQALVTDWGNEILVIAILRNAPNEVLMVVTTEDFEPKAISNLIFH
ncbi:hypothetical protein IMF27_27795 [Pseudomonas sp. PCH199]|uniref:hypothetical protein n=1 Tax=unclassified Pseudomonas TaxID=196821 RepID=UPI000BD216C8|nr:MULTISPECIES: hypothetical protein [unclassified Pseudomonas]MCW8278848.1 hypothetical protein [Pseudomonas sp. PCH199]PAM80956.1 hypothetical protein CES87_28425 [Pseudomonas sp. ERMR1:02]